MNCKKTIYIIILSIATFVGAWAIPALVRKLTYTPDHYPFVHYSSILKQMCLIDRQNKKRPMTDSKGNVYNIAQFDSLLPLLNYRQLMADGRLPDSIDGHAITPQLLRASTVIYKYTPSDMNTPDHGLYVMFESMPKRLGLEMPPDVFRIRNAIQFIDAATNKVDEKKSEQFSQMLEKRGYTFPTQWAAGNPNPRKPYDEGYFCLDAKGKLFHIKMVNGRPFVQDTKVGDTIEAAYFSMMEVADKRFYGFLFSKTGAVYIVESNERGYFPRKLDIPKIDIYKDELMLMGNLLYWTVAVTTESGKKHYALRSETLEKVDQYAIDRTPGKWDRYSEWLFPVYVTIKNPESGYIFPKFHFTGLKGFATNILLLIFAMFVFRNSRNKLLSAMFVLITGLPGFIALLILPGFNSKN